MKAESGLIHIKKRYRRFVRAVAVFFLLFTGADILRPQYFCDDEIGGISLPTASAATLNTEERGADDSKVAAIADSFEVVIQSRNMTVVAKSVFVATIAADPPTPT